MIDKKKLRSRLNKLYNDYNKKKFVEPDPLQFLYAFRDVRDREVVGLVASSLAFGNVKQINRSISKVLEVLTDGGSSKPATVVASWSKDKLKRRLKGFRHRWVNADDVAGLLHRIGIVFSRYGSVEACFRYYMQKDSGQIKAGIDGLVGEIRGDRRGGSYGVLIKQGERGFCGSLLPKPYRSSAYKRINLFLRWMVRKDDVDPGGWKAVRPAELLCPVDTHIRKLAEELEFTSRRVVNFGMVQEITDAFREVSPEDPVKYDFALTRFGIRDDLAFEQLVKRLKGRGVFA